MKQRLIRAITGLCLTASLTWLDGGFLVSTERGLAFHPSMVAHASAEAVIRAELSRLLRDPEFQTRAIRQMEVPPGQEAVYLEHMEKAWGNDAVMSVFLDDLLQLIEVMQLDDREARRNLTRNFASAWFQEKSFNGVRRLKSEEQREFFRFALLLTKVVSTEHCAAIAREELSAPELARVEIQGFSVLPTATLRAYLGILRKALIAEVTEHPPVPTLGPSERMVVEETIGAQLFAALGNHPNGERLALGLDNQAYLSDAELCELNTMILDLAVEERGQIGEWVIRYMLL
ncbi:MAG: hypothetical protein U5L98_16600 [Halomonas sp.]|uniref:hypothetical protein n=1 Tax=Halomonas sp. TaxID=1486246 RepID=UPI002ACF0492|nr:hypothetical protein [Halomonas sp.]MDZ7854203.1 hypothetical protein [Halomonas sp.]